jgi:hypothetical protein
LKTTFHDELVDRLRYFDGHSETGSKATTTRRLIELCGGRYVGLSLLVDQLPSELHDELAPVAAVAKAEELRESGLSTNREPPRRST